MERGRHWKMRVQWQFCVFFTILGCLVYGVHCEPSVLPSECAPWTRLSNGINQYQGKQNKGMDIACKDHSHDKCEQLDCGGRYNLDFVSLELNVCMGLVFHHCNNPPAIEVNIQLPTLNSTIHKLIVHNDTIPIPGLSRNVGRNRAEVVLYVELMRRNTTSFFFRMSGRVRLTTTVFGREITDWPEHLQRDIITIDNIPVSRCSTTTNATLSPLKVCDVSDYIGTAPDSTVKPSTPIKITSIHYNKSCTSGSMRQSQCGYGEACINNRCLCAYDYQLSSHGVCDFIGKTRPGPILNIPISQLDPSQPGVPLSAGQNQSSNPTKVNSK
ncbi:uncharacterized protein LOC117315855 [Pecten maximus]|uniref:uncharacterized protein LOC117315855 n=1 Tax=Pecten maximus TaxID=6579 RepID=UPI001458B192|nr:uncharacterized protein LOC117315855 [Pecten maximus]